MGNAPFGKRWRRVLNAAMLAGSAAVTLIALTIVIAVFWWVMAPSGNAPERAAAPRQRAPQAHAAAAPQPVAQPPAAALPPAPAPANPAVQPGVAVAPQPAVPPAQTGPGNKRTRDRDAEMNRGIAQGLQNLAQDPEAVRQLGFPDQGPAPAQ